MIEVIDRIPTYPGRVKMIPVDGQPNTYDMVRADNPTEPGTPINKALFDSIISDFNGVINEFIALRTQVNSTLLAISNRSLIGDLVAGTEIALEENGILVPFIKIQHGYEGATGSLVMRKHCVTKMPLVNTSDTKYPDGRADKWLNNEYFATLGSTVQAVALQAPFDCRITEYSGGGSTSMTKTYNRKVFLLSSYELCLTPSYGISTEGEQISYFNSSSRRTATYNGVLTDYYTRAFTYNPYATTVRMADTITTVGSTKAVTNPTEYSAGIRPVLFLPNTFEVSVGDPNTTNVMATAGV